MTDIDLLQAQREQALDIAREQEQSFLDSTRDATVRELYLLMKRGLKAERLLEMPLGKALVDACVTRIVTACDLWLTTSDESEIAKAKIEAQGAMAAIRLFDEVMLTSADAEKQLRTIEDEIGESL